MDTIKIKGRFKVIQTHHVVMAGPEAGNAKPMHLIVLAGTSDAYSDEMRCTVMDVVDGLVFPWTTTKKHFDEAPFVDFFADVPVRP